MPPRPVPRRRATPPRCHATPPRHDATPALQPPVPAATRSPRGHREEAAGHCTCGPPADLGGRPGGSEPPLDLGPAGLRRRRRISLRSPPVRPIRRRISSRPVSGACGRLPQSSLPGVGSLHGSFPCVRPPARPRAWRSNGGARPDTCGRAVLCGGLPAACPTLGASTESMQCRWDGKGN